MYQIDEPSKTVGAQHATIADKGNEAMAYLQFIIDYYLQLPNATVFLHGHRQELILPDDQILVSCFQIVLHTAASWSPALKTSRLATPQSTQFWAAVFQHISRALDKMLCIDLAKFSIAVVRSLL